MSRAEKFIEEHTRNCSNDIIVPTADGNTFSRGYEYWLTPDQAEKDLELSWEDISKIISIDQQVCGTMGISDYTHNHQQAIEEVLKRFNKERKEK